MTAPLRDPSLPKPLPPADDDCCGGGACCPCVWDDYYTRLQDWRVKQAAYRETLKSSPSAEKPQSK